MKTYDAIIVGFGKGGKTLAGYMAKQGKRVAMIEKSAQMYGGTCINEGCIPSKSLIIQAEQQSYAQAVERKEALITKLRKKNFDKLDSLALVDVITAEATFISDHEVHVQGNGIDEILYGEYLFINTGSTANIPAIKGIKETKHIYTSAEMMKERSLPEKLAIIGGGYIGLEFSSMYARYGSNVTVFEYGNRLVKREDADIADEIQKVLEKQGVSFVFESRVKEVANDKKQVVITYDDKDGAEQKVTVDAVLLAAGRSANTKGLGLEKAKVALDQRGNVIVNEYLQTSVPHIYAMGDVRGGLQFTYISLDDFRIVRSAVLGDGSYDLKKRGAVPYSVFLDPPFSRVGLSEKEAVKAGYRVKTARLAAAAIPKAQVLEQPAGLLKAVIDEETGLILGAHLFCEESYEMINMIKLAMDAKVSYTVLRDAIYTHPTMSEAFNDLFAV